MNKDPFYDDGVEANNDNVSQNDIAPNREELIRTPSPPVPKQRTRAVSPAGVSQSENAAINDETLIDQNENPTQSVDSSDSSVHEEQTGNMERTALKELVSEPNNVRKLSVIPTTIITKEHTKDAIIQTDSANVSEHAVQTEYEKPVPAMRKREIIIAPDESNQTQTISPTIKSWFDRDPLVILPIIGFCNPLSMTSRSNDVILTLPKHLMMLTEQNSVTVYPWNFPDINSAPQIDTLLECYWSSFLYKLLVTSSNSLFIYDLTDHLITDSITLRGSPLTVNRFPTKTLLDTSSLPTTRNIPLTSYKSTASARFTTSNSDGIFYCFSSTKYGSSMLAKINHNTRQHERTIDCDKTVCTMASSEKNIAVVTRSRTSHVLTLYDNDLIGIRKIILPMTNDGGVSSIVYLSKTWLVFDHIQQQVTGIGKKARRFTKQFSEQPMNCCVMNKGTCLAVWFGFPGAIAYYK